MRTPRATGSCTSTFQTIVAEATKIFQVLVGVPARADRVLTLVERGELNVQTPVLDLRVRRLERSVSRIAGGLVFAALLIAGAILYGPDPGFGKLLMAASVLPLGWVMISARQQHPGR